MERKSHLSTACNTDSGQRDRSAITNYTLQHIHVNHRYKLLYCPIPKVACTSLKTLMVQSIEPTVRQSRWKVHSTPWMHKIGIDELVMYPRDEVNRMLSEYTKVMFVRHPFERLISAYRDKFENYTKPSFFHQQANKIRMTLGDNSSGALSLHQFFGYLNRTDVQMYNDHWGTYERICDPCRVHYDFIGKYDTFDRDVLLFIQHFYPEATEKTLNKYMPSMNQNTVNTHTVLKDILSVLDEKLIQNVQLKYRHDFDMFNYH